MQTAMVISPHADDAAIYCGATLAKFAARGWRVILTRVTDDCRESFGLTVEETRKRNTAELHLAASILGVTDIIELDYEDDFLINVPHSILRERFVYLFRRFRPYIVFTFDPNMGFDTCMDYTRTAQAVDESFRLAAYDLYCPEHFKEGLKPHSVCERWYFGQFLPHANHTEDISEYLFKKVDALCAHSTIMQHRIHQYQMQLEAAGKRVPLLDEGLAGNLRSFVELLIQEQASMTANAFRMPEGCINEVFRRERFGIFEEFFQMTGEPLPQSEAIF